MKRRLGLAAMLALVCATASCGDGDARFSSGLPGDTQLRDVAPDDKAGFCQGYGAWIDDRVAPLRTLEARCQIGALLFASDAAACTDLVNRCLADPDQAPFITGEAAQNCAESDFASCPARISDIERCINGQLELIETLAASRCDDAGSITLPLDAAHCDTIDDRCPNL